MDISVSDVYLFHIPQLFGSQIADNRILELEATRDLSKLWLHVDMDAFYAAVEALSDPSLEGKPMAVGSMSMISTANYEVFTFYFASIDFTVGCIL